MKSGFTTMRKTGLYITHRPVHADEILRMAQRLIQRKFKRGKLINNPQDAADLFIIKLAVLEHETFWILFLDNGHRILVCEQMFRGTVNQAMVYPREVVKRALQFKRGLANFSPQPPLRRRGTQCYRHRPHSKIKTSVGVGRHHVVGSLHRGWR